MKSITLLKYDDMSPCQKLEPSYSQVLKPEFLMKAYTLEITY